MAAEGRLDLVALVQPEQPVIHEDAGEPVADGPVHQRGRDRGVDAAREPADHPLIGPDQLADPGDLGLHEMPGRPVRGDAADLEQEVVEDLAAPRRVRHLGMELHAEQRPLGVLERRDGAVVARGGDAIPRRRHVHVVAMTHPDRGLLARGRSR